MNRISNLIAPYVKTLGLEGALRLEELRREWGTLFGEPLSFHMSPASLRNDELLINVDSPVWLQQISFYKADILKKLRRFRITEVRFRLGKVRQDKEAPKKSPSPGKWKTLDESEVQYIEQTLSGLDDEGVRESVRKAMQKAFTRKTG